MSQQRSNTNRNVVKNDRRSNKPKRKGPRGQRKQGRMQVYGAAYNQLRRDIGWLMQFVNTETKYVDNTSGGLTPIAVGYNITLLNGLSLGTTSTTRIGQSVKCVGIELRYHAMINPIATTCCVIRLFLVRDTQANAAQPTFTDIYPSGTITPRVVSYLDRFQVIHENTFMLNNAGNGGVINDWIVQQNWHVDYNTLNNGTIADITKNSLYLAYITSVTTNMPDISWTTRFAFVDN